MVKSKHYNSRPDLLINKRKIVKSKRSQEEMVGFVLIIVLVAVIVLVFLGISLRKTGEIRQNKEIENFLHSSLLYTTSCYKSPEIVLNLKDLIGSCYDNDKCLDERNSCDVLNEVFVELIDKSWNIGENSLEKAYIINIYEEGNKENPVLYLSDGEETSTKKGADILLYVEDLHINMNIFY